MARMLGRARSAHDLMWCCPGHDPGHRPGMKEIGRRAQRARETQAVRGEAQRAIRDQAPVAQPDRATAF